MTDLPRLVRRFVVFCTAVLVVACLYWVQAVFVPLALATLLSFLLTPLTVRLQRRLGRVPAVAIVVVLAFVVLALAGWGLGHQVASLADELPRYRDNIRQKIADVRHAGRGGSLGKMTETVKDIQEEIQNPGEAAPPGKSVTVVQPEKPLDVWRLPATFGSALGALATAGLVSTLVIFMLLERQELRDRLIQLGGHGRLTVTTRAFDEAASRIIRYLLMQSLINGIFGLGVGIGLWLLDVPYALIWASLALVLRFVPYIGSWVAALAPIVLSLAAFEGWTRPIMVVGLFLLLELFANLVLEPLLYADAAGVSQVALLTAVAFWTWLWGPIGLMLATPLTVCLVVLGKHVRGLEHIVTLLGAEPTIGAEMRFYQRLLADDRAEALEIVEEHVDRAPDGSVYDALLIPALAYARQDVAGGRLTEDEAHDVYLGAAQVLADMAPESPPASPGEGNRPASRVRVVGCPARGESDEIALRMFARLLDATSFEIDVLPSGMLAAEATQRAAEGSYAIACIGALPSEGAAATKYLIKRLRATVPGIKVIVGSWGPPGLGDATTDGLRTSGADYVARSLTESRDQLYQLATMLPRQGSGVRNVEVA